MSFTTDSANGLLYWQGQEPNNDGVVENYIAVSSKEKQTQFIRQSISLTKNKTVLSRKLQINFLKQVLDLFAFV